MDNALYLLALPLLALVVLIVKILSKSTNRNLSINLKGLGVELSIHSYGENNVNKRMSYERNNYES